MKHPAKILLVDDDSLTLKATRLILEAAGYEVSAATTGAEGLRLATASPPDLALLDRMLPDMDGIEVCRRLKADPATACVFVALMSGVKTSGDDRAEGLETGADDYIVRPISNRELLARVQAMLRIKQAEEKIHYQADLLANVSDAVISTDLDFVIRTWNRAAESMYGWQESEVIGKRVGEVLRTEYPADDGERVLRQFLAEGVWKGEIIQRRKDGTPIPILASVSFIRDGASNPTGVVAVNRDITERKQAEEELRESRQYLQAVLDSINDAVFVDDADTGEIIDVNRSMCEMYGYSREEALNTPIGDLSQGEPPYSQAEALEWLHKARKIGPQTFEWLAKHKDGHLFWVEVSIRFAVIGGHNRFVVIVHDITERKEAERKIRESEETYRNLFQNAQVGLFRTRISDGKILESNEQLARMFGYDSREEFIAEYVTSQNYVDPGTRERMLHELQANGMIQNFEARFYRKDGSIFWAQYSAKIYPEKGWIEGVAEDITARKEAEEQLRAALAEAEQARRTLLSVIEDQKRAEEALAAERSLLRTLVDHLPDAVYIKDAATRKTLANPADVRNIGAASEAEVLGKTDFELFPPELAEAYYADDRRVLETGEAVLNREERITRPDGTLGWQLTSKVPLRDEAGRIIGLIGIGHDITARKQAEQLLHLYAEQLEAMVAARTRALEEAQERLLRQERLATLGQLAGGIAHELRTPLGAIKNAAYLIKLILEPQAMAPNADPALREALDILNREVGTADRIITSLLSFAHPQQPAHQLIDVSQVVMQVLAHADIPPQVAVHRQIDKNLPTILADAGQLEQVFGNLISNAVQAMPGGGQLTVRVERRAALPDIAPPGFATNPPNGTAASWVAVTIADTGVGIPPENLPHIFEPLFTTKARGIGLGLPIVKLLAQANGGSITLSSIPGQGTTFETFWPVVPFEESPRDP